MSLIDKIHNDKLTCRKAKDASGVNTRNLVISEVQRKQKNLSAEPTDKDVITAIKGLVKSLEFTLSKLKEVNEHTGEVEKELDIYKSYLPALLSEEDTKVIVAEAIKASGATSMKDFGKVMGFLKKTPNLDMKLASQIAKSQL